MMPAFDMDGPPPELLARIEEYHQARLDNALAERRLQLKFAAVLCTCRPMGSWPPGHRQEIPPPQAGCPIHSAFLMTHDGEIL